MVSSGEQTNTLAEDTEPLSRWERRTGKRVFEASQNQLLERSRQIVEAAYELLKEGGLDGLTIRAVLQRTGLSRRAFYERFAGKDDLMLAVFEETICAATRHYAEQVEKIADPKERLKLIVTSIVIGKRASARQKEEKSDRRGAAMSREHMRLAESRPEELQEVLRPLISLIARLLSDAMAAGEVRRTDPERLAKLVYNLVSTTAHTELLTQHSDNPDVEGRYKLAEDVWEFCLHAISA